MQHGLQSVRRHTRVGASCAPRRLVGALGVLILLAAGACAAFRASTQTSKPERAQTPLSGIAGVEVPPPVATQPLDQVPEVQAAVEQARAHIEDGRFQKALETLGEVVDKPGGNRHEVHYLLAHARARLGQFEAAQQSAQNAARLGHGAADVHCLLGKLYRRQGSTESAIAHFRTATRAAERELNNPNVTLAWYHLGQTLAQAGYDLAAAQAYQHFDQAAWQTHPEQRNAPEIGALLAGRPHGMVPERLRLLKRLGRSAAALRVADWAREIWPDDPYVDRLYAQTLLFAGAAERAFTFCQQRFEDAKAARDLAPVAIDAARATGQLEQWVGVLVRAVEQGDDLELAWELTRSLNVAGAPSEAVRLGRALLAQRPDDATMVWELAAAQQAMGDLRGALRTLIAFVRNKPDLSALPQRRLAAWRRWLGPGVDLDTIVKDLRARDEADFATDFVLGVSALAAERLALADELLQSCLAARPDFAPARIVQGQMLLATYEWDAAKAHAEEVIEEAPGLAAAHYVLAEAYNGLDENEPAEQAYKQAIKLRPDEPAYTFALARHYRRLGNLRGAQRYFQETLANDPGNGEALEGLIDCYILGNKVEIARAQLERLDETVVPPDTWRRVSTVMRFLPAPFGDEHLAELSAQFEQHPDDIATARYLAGGLYQWGRLDEAREVIVKALEASPDDFHLSVLQANVHAQREEFDAAISRLQELVRRFPNRRSVLEPLALYSVYDFRFEEGRPALGRLIELEEDPAARNDYRETLRDSFVVLGEFEEALRLVEQWIQKEPNDDTLLLHKAIVLLHAERSDEAFAVLEAWLDRDPGDTERRERFYRAASLARQYEPTLARIRQWLEDDPASATLTEWLIDVLIWADRPDEALEVARQFEGTYSESIARRIWLGRCHAARGDVDQALAEFDALLGERVIDEVQRREVWNHIAETLLSAACIDRALERCEQWLKEAEGLSPVFRPLALHWKRRVLQTAGRDRESAEVMEALLEYLPVLTMVLDDPDYNVGLFNDLGYVWVDLGMNLERATVMIRRAVAADPWSAAFIDSLGWAYYKAGDFSNAHKYLSRAARLREGQDAVIYDHLGDAAYRLRDQAAARRHWQKALGLLEAESSEREGVRLAELIAAVRAKLAALERSQRPPLAPTASEQHKPQKE